LEVLYTRAIETRSDIVIGNVVYCREDGRQELQFQRNNFLNDVLSISGEQAFVNLIEAKAFPPMIFLYFIKRSFVGKHRLFFKELRYHADELWCVKAIFNAKMVSLIDFNYYFYRQREGSITHSGNKTLHVQSFFEVIRELRKFASKLKREKASSEAISALYLKIFWMYNHVMNTWPESITPEIFPFADYFSRLLIEVYPTLSVQQQIFCAMTHRMHLENQGISIE
jgi:hypothetical protein